MTFSSAFVHILKVFIFSDMDNDSTNGKHFFFLKDRYKSPSNTQFHNLFFFLHWNVSIIHHCYLTFSGGHFKNNKHVQKGER